ncbi:NUDIX hydrolase [Propioniciclava tarda]|uniref:NrtR DNA-binding winged helix domain-containing protein n=1 Tax=Propioniciclava tarda TaxID=433330 RepID=A0A4Q9KKD2_PROTD|nr:hypothetical protein [Propioniciclava tarda]TBT94913.1 hypothetical protein ET996_07810 [Propioniciclava tarda]SMO58539.1 Uncharacterized conserved protein [Propioniciclava tarda]HQA31644.1 hypothetical protein [Propioniciclava tarda]
MTTTPTPDPTAAQAVAAEVVAVVVAMVDGTPCVLEVNDATRLPSGPLLEGHRSLQAAVRAWAESQTGRQLGYLEQLYTFADSDRDRAARRISICYLGLTANSGTGPRSGVWRPWYELFPSEDLRDGTSALDAVVGGVRTWVEDADATARERRAARAASLFGLDSQPWEPDLALQRYELLYEAGLIAEAPGGVSAPFTGVRMDADHRRIVATAVARLRAKITYRPVVFELMPDEFTLGQLQSCVEALAGRAVHTQNFRRLIEQQALVEDTGASAATGGRPARLYRFRRDVVQQRSAAGTKLPTTRSR